MLSCIYAQWSLVYIMARTQMGDQLLFKSMMTQLLSANMNDLTKTI